MSFYSEIRANEQARSTGGGFNAADLVEDVKQNLYFIGQNLATLRKSTKTLGTPKDSIILRQNMYLRSDFRNKTIDSTRNLCKETGIKIKQLATVGTQENLMIRTKLSKDFEKFLKEYQEATREATTQERQVPLPHSERPSQPQHQSPYHNPDVERESLLDQEREASYRQQQEQQVFNDQIIREREEGIKEIERQMIDVHEIFVDLSNLVTEQGLMLDNIESNIDSTYSNTQAANVDLRKAAASQKSSRNKMCIIIIVLALVLGALVIGGVLLGTLGPWSKD